MHTDVGVCVYVCLCIHKYVEVKNLSTFCIHMLHTYIIYIYIYIPAYIDFPSNTLYYKPYTHIYPKP